MKKKVLITGGLGLIGKSLTKILLNNYKILIIDKHSQILRHKSLIKYYKSKDITFISCNILNKKKLVRMFKKVDYVVHLAAMLGVKNTEENKDLCWRVNTEGTQNVVDACKVNKVKKLIFSSSSEVYGEQGTKKKILENNKILGINIYSLSKIAAENYIKIKLLKSKTKYTILRLFNTYGEGQVAQFFITKLCYCSVYKKKFIINGNGNQLRSYGYCDDVALGIKSCLEKKISNGKVYNLGNSKEVYSLKNVVKLVSKITKRKLKIIYDYSFNKGDRFKNREIYQRICSTQKARREIDYNPEISLYNGLKRVLNQKKIFKDWAK